MEDAGFGQRRRTPTVAQQRRDSARASSSTVLGGGSLASSQASAEGTPTGCACRLVTVICPRLDTRTGLGPEL